MRMWPHPSKKSLFKFSAIVLLSKESRALLMDEIDTDDIVSALSDADEKLRESVFEVLSQRNKRLVEAELARTNAAQEVIEKAQKKFVGIALKLSKQGVIELPQAD